jgi:hypothetical protein
LWGAYVMFSIYHLMILVAGYVMLRINSNEDV